MVKLSIIVPIYGVEQYLRKCVDSLLNQNIPSSEYEVILVDDGGHDMCPQICDSYAAAHENIRVAHRDNGGLSAARNSGIEVAQGEYIMFVDSDDYLEPNVLGALLEQVEREQLDVLRYDYQNVRRVESEYEVFQPYKHPHIVDVYDEIAGGETYLNTHMRYECYAWQFLIRRNLIIDDRCIDDRCFFTEGIHFEDVDWLPRMMLKAKRVGCTQTVVYNYFWREGSITQTQGNMEKIRKNVEDEMNIIERYTTFRTQYPECIWLQNMQSSMAAGVLTTIAHEFYDERKEYINRLRKMDVFPLAIADQGKTYERRARIINAIGANLYCAIMHLRK